MHRAGLVLLDLGVGKMRRQHRETRAAPSASARPSRGRRPRARSRRPPACGRARDCARALRRRESDPGGASRATAEWRPARPPRPPTAAAAPCRNRRARPRARLPGCRRTAPAADRAAGSRPSTAASRAAAPAAPGGSCRPASFLVHAQQQPRHLHGDGRAARQRAPVAQQQPSGPADRQRIDAVVAAEALVLEGDQHGEVARIDLLHLRRQAPAAVGRRVGAQQPVVAVEHRDGQRLGAGQRQRLQIGPRPRHQPGDAGQQRRPLPA